MRSFHLIWPGQKKSVVNIKGNNSKYLNGRVIILVHCTLFKLISQILFKVVLWTKMWEGRTDELRAYY